MKYFSDLGAALKAMDADPDKPRRRKYARDVTTHENFEQDDGAEYIDVREKYMVTDDQYDDDRVDLEVIDAHFQADAIPLSVDEVSQKKDGCSDPSNDPGFYDTLPDESTQYDPYNESNLSLTNMKAEVPVDTGNGAEILMTDLNATANQAQALMSEVQTQLQPIASSAAQQTPKIISAIQSKDIVTAAAFSGLAWWLVPSFIPGAKYLPLAIMAVWAAGQGDKPKA